MIADWRIDDAVNQLADNPPRQLAAYRELLRDLHRIPADTQGSYTAHLAGDFT